MVAPPDGDSCRGARGRAAPSRCRTPTSRTPKKRQKGRPPAVQSTSRAVAFASLPPRPRLGCTRPELQRRRPPSGSRAPWASSSSRGTEPGVSARQLVQDARPAARPLTKGRQIIFFVGGVNAVIVEAETNEQAVHAELGLEGGDDRD